jgi:hypothetical protein
VFYATTATDAEQEELLFQWIEKNEKNISVFVELFPVKRENMLSL